MESLKVYRSGHELFILGETFGVSLWREGGGNLRITRRDRGNILKLIEEGLVRYEREGYTPLIEI